MLSSAARQRAFEWQRAGLLHGGEAEALALALEIKTDWLLTDDAAARLMAESLNIEVHGSIGVVLWMAANKRLKKLEAESLLAGLEKSSLWMSPEVRAEARITLGKLFS
jgi:predicted nucleic acid-binding protein